MKQKLTQDDCECSAPLMDPDSTLCQNCLGNINNAPRYQHDCDRCAFVGRLEQYDIYHCPGTMGGSVIARYGDIGKEYASADLEIAKLIHTERILHRAYLMILRKRSL